MRCSYTRWKMSSALDDGGAAALEAIAARGHASRCARCQGYARSLGRLHTQLERGARELGVPPPVAGAARPARWPVLAGGTAMAAMAAVVLVVSGGDRLPPPAPPERVSGPAGRALQHTAVRVARAATVAGASLETELRALIDDGTRGVGAVLASSGLREPSGR